MHRPGLARRAACASLLALLACACAAAAARAGAASASASAPAPAPACQGTIYLTFDTGNQSQAELIAQVLKRHHVQATFFLANEKTTRGDYSLAPSWAAYWKARVAEGHAFGSHTFDHVYWKKDGGQGGLVVQPQFGAHAGQSQQWSGADYCAEIKRSDQRFAQLTGRALDPIWRAPGGKVSARSLAAGQACGYAHVPWSAAGFSGDELSSDTHPNAALLKKSLGALRDGDIFLAHMGIWSRQDPWAPANLEPLIVGLRDKGFCFATLRSHPDYRQLFQPRQP
ncbi:polysaccharide deacetylase family protein [Oxalobacteraceae bacterium]|nr:polysaccharide deacetylase family protein [Oxalobacteraceae bacterium]